MKPTFTHDCDVCRFLGRGDGCDLYFCPSRGGFEFGSVIARYANRGSAYASAPVGVIKSATRPLGLMWVTLQRAVELAGVAS